MVTEQDVADLDAEVAKLKKLLKDYEAEVEKNSTVDMEELTKLTTVAREIDPEQSHCLLIGMRQCYMLPVGPEYTVADVKRFINHKGGRDAYPLGSLDVRWWRILKLMCWAMESMELFVNACMVRRRLPRTIPLYWGKRLQDPK